MQSFSKDGEIPKDRSGNPPNFPDDKSLHENEGFKEREHAIRKPSPILADNKPEIDKGETDIDPQLKRKKSTGPPFQFPEQNRIDLKNMTYLTLSQLGRAAQLVENT